MTELGNWIGGRREPWAGPRGESRSPHDDELLATFPLSGPSEVARAVAAARAAFDGWRRTPAPVRGRILLNAWQRFAAAKDELAALIAREEGKLVREAAGEIQRGLNVLEFTAGEGYRLCGETVPSELPGNYTFTLRTPLGVVAAITPWNFPFAIPVWKLAPALVAGNTVVWKPASLTPLVADRVAAIFHEAGLPPGVLNVVFGGGGPVGDAVVDHPDVAAVTFTGSTEVGLGIHRRLGGQLKKLTLELGGKNAVVVLADADLDLAARGILDGAFGSTGQRCTATSRVVVVREVARPLVERLEAGARRVVVGDPLDPSSEMGPLVERRARDKAVAAVAEATRQGLPVVGGEPVPGPGAYMRPAVVLHTPPDHPLWQEEIFAPVLSVAEAADAEEAFRLANGVRYGLTASVYTRDVALAFQAMEALEVGMVHVNSPTVGGEAQLPFGGVKSSGYGPREMAKEGVLFFTELRTVYVDATGAPRRVNLY
jgi:acyl-CoA reductase-like NAD-dependent aldehyde dehydrogenase